MIMILSRDFRRDQRFAGDDAERAAVARRGPGKKFRRFCTAGAGHVPKQDGGGARQMLAEMAGVEARGLVVARLRLQSGGGASAG